MLAIAKTEIRLARGADRSLTILKALRRVECVGSKAVANRRQPVAAEFRLQTPRPAARLSTASERGRANHGGGEVQGLWVALPSVPGMLAALDRPEKACELGCELGEGREGREGLARSWRSGSTSRHPPCQKHSSAVASILRRHFLTVA